MRKGLFFNRKAVIASILMVSILVSVSTITPAIHDLKISNIAIRNHQINEQRLEKTNSDYIINHNDYDNKNNFGIPKGFIEDIIEYFDLLSLDKSELKDLIINKLLPLTNEIKDLHLGEKSFKECSQELQDICFIFEKYNNFEDVLDEEIKQSNLNEDISQDFMDYSIPYRQLYSILYGDVTENKILGDYNRVWFALRVFGSVFDEKNYYDWFYGIQDKIDFMRGLTIIFGGFSIAVLAIVPVETYLINGGAALLIFLFFWFNAHLASYVHNGHEYFQMCKNKEVNILLHVVDEEGNGIPDYKIQDIYAVSTDAMNWIDEKGEDETKGRDTHYFQYILGSSDCMNDNGEIGWYSLETRHIAEGYSDPLAKYKKAPCPPGNWEIHIDANEYYLSYENKDVYVDPGSTIIINATLLNHH